jgi:hypothetical protein
MLTETYKKKQRLFNETVITLGIELLLCAILAFISVFGKVRK